MNRQSFRTRVKSSRFAPAAALPGRARLAGGHSVRVVRDSARWLVRSREHENFTYDLTDINLEHLAWFVAEVADVPIAEAHGYLAEVEADDRLRRHLEKHARTGSQPGLADAAVRYGRRVGWYALVRAIKPDHIVETGTDKGLGTCVLAAAVLANGRGRITTIDVDAAAGHLIQAPYDSVVDLRIADSITTIAKLDRIDFLLHDSDHSLAHEQGEFDAAAHLLAPSAWVLSDNAHFSAVLPRWAREQDRRFLYFAEEPADHWYPGGGIGVAWNRV